ncbi:alpha-L-rhamnosidase C-terminal domain-containing protein [Promicromonospora umidemergens]|uniref:alpha-L-rhamnosidase C-terminal domain-containing protein n=1 Tax=Promicromonospora umidemergens TaxID=629679 RepID=UPI003558686D
MAPGSGVGCPTRRIEVAWRRRRSGREVTVTAPVNATAEVALPGGATHVVGSGRHRLRP